MRFYTALLVTAAMLLVGVAKAHAAPLVGIGEQSPEMFSDADYAALDVHHDPWETTKLDSYLLDAKAQGTHVLLSFGRSNRHTRTLPSARTLAHEFKRFRARYPWVTDYVTWNEANHC